MELGWIQAVLTFKALKDFKKLRLFVSTLTILHQKAYVTSPQVRVLVGGVHVDAPAVVPRALPAPVVHVHGGRARLPRLPTRGATRPPLLSHRQTGNLLHYLTTYYIIIKFGLLQFIRLKL